MSQNQQILAALQSGMKITPMTALRLYGCFRLAARILDLRNDGHDIKTDMVWIKKGEKRVARYSLEAGT